ncbi:hypothetical protein HD806DRAFT_522336 [Xylariaceae sp. AK1471]|nr:hypothetical protein HD806DRAFT_522336 [Xylariaceae sp. AK1471]
MSSYNRMQQAHTTFLNGTYRWQQAGLFSSTTLYVAVIAWAAYLAGLAVYRLVFSPLAKIPGPKIAAFTYFYEIYYDVLLEGQYFRQIAKMHETYGPIVRINPHEVHFNDPEFIDPLFPGPARKTDEYEFTGRRTGSKHTTHDHAMCHFPIVGTILAKAPDWAIHTFLPGLSDKWNKKGTIFEGILNISKSRFRRTADLYHIEQQI